MPMPLFNNFRRGIFARCSWGDAHYSVLCYADGTVVDDIFLYKLSGRWLVIVNASNRAKDWTWIEHHLHDYDTALIDRSDELAMLALQGPKAEQILQKLTSYPLHTVATRTAVETEIGGLAGACRAHRLHGRGRLRAVRARRRRGRRSGSLLLATGKDDGLLACGLAARDSLRFEACMPLYGHELSPTINPLEARLGWTMSWDKPFIGRETLLKVKLEKPARVLVGLEMVEKAVPREHYDVAVEWQGRRPHHLRHEKPHARQVPGDGLRALPNIAQLGQNSTSSCAGSPNKPSSSNVPSTSQSTSKQR
jgi:aminomethyltransferase